VKVSELTEVLGGRQEERLNTSLGKIEISDDASTLNVEGNEFHLDELAENSLANYLKINRTYLAQCPSDLKVMNFRYWLNHRDNANVMIESVDNNITGFFRPDTMLIPVASVAEIVGRIFSADDEVKDLRRDDERFHIDVTSSAHSVDVPNPDRIAGRPEVGDITSGGVRILAYPNAAVAPSVSAYLHRLVCRNGMTEARQEGTIRLKGKTVPEVLVEMEQAARQVLSGLDEKLTSYARMAQRGIPGNASSFVYQIAREHNIGPRVLNRLMERANLLPDNATLYDVQQIFTEVANSGVKYRTMTALQDLGGELAFHTERVLHRCGQCERLLPE
jgi:hypothetical protein